MTIIAYDKSFLKWDGVSYFIQSLQWVIAVWQVSNFLAISEDPSVTVVWQVSNLLAISEDPIVTVKCRTDIKTLFLYVKLCLYVMLDSLSCSFTSIFFRTNSIILFGFLVLTETTVRRQTCHATHLTNCEPTNLSSYALKLCAWQRNSKYQFYASLVLPDRESNPRYIYIVPEESTLIDRVFSCVLLLLRIIENCMHSASDGHIWCIRTMRNNRHIIEFILAV
jgi:hypothetical protein